MSRHYDDDLEELPLESNKQKTARKIIALLLIVVFLGAVIFAAWPRLHLPSLDFLFDSAQYAQDERVLAYQEAVVQVSVVADPDTAFAVSGQSQGTGFNVSEAGLIVTNYHVVEDAGKIVVRFSDGSVYDVLDWNGNAEWDLAFLELADASELPSLTLGSSASLQEGDSLMIIGNPFGLRGIVIEGVLGRRLNISSGPPTILELLAPIHPGNSGSPVLGTEGRVVGVVFGTFEDANETRGLALPVEYVLLGIPENSKSEP